MHVSSSSIKPGTFIKEIVKEDYRTADVFKRLGINYCCSGGISLFEACAAKEIDYDLVEKELSEAIRTIYVSNVLQFSEWKIDFLIDYIINVHHAYLYTALPSLELRLSSFIEGHKKKHAELIKVYEVFTGLSNFLAHHNRHEEEIIFPYIKQINTAHQRKESYGNLFVRTLRKPLDNVEKEHSVIGENLKKIELYTNNFVPPANACTNHQVLYHKLHEVYNDLIQHKHLERNILFPKAIEIERELLQL
jgi:regulator of cell morphogenesis and NO signaling